MTELPFQPFLLTAQGRDGGNWLGNLIAGHPSKSVRWDNELFIFHGKWGTYKNYPNAASVLSAETFNLANQCEFAGLKYAPFMCNRGSKGTSGLVPYLRSLRPALRVIHLERRNLLRSIVSMKIARKTRVWHIRSEDERPKHRPQVAISKPELLNQIQGRLHNYLTARRQFFGFPALSVNYEDLLREPETWVRSVYQFLGLDSTVMIPKSGTLRLEHRPLRESLLNYDKLEEIFRGSRWQHLFDDDAEP